MPISAVFSDLGAPLRNIRWSWGAVNPTSGAVILRVWTDETRKHNGWDVVRLTNRAHFEGRKSLGYAERTNHIQLLCNGRPGFLFFCEAKESGKIPRRLKSYRADRIFPTGRLCEVDGDVYVQYLDGESVTRIKQK
jgi:hypothetical protein